MKQAIILHYMSISICYVWISILERTINANRWSEIGVISFSVLYIILTTGFMYYVLKNKNS